MNGFALHNRPALIEYGHQRFLITDAPTDQNLAQYQEEFRKANVHTIVRACEPTYSVIPLTKANIEVVEMPFADGDPPPENIITEWLNLCDREFADPESKRAVAVHCVAGLGRAPVLVAVALIEAGMEPLDAVAFIRKKRRGAINARQLTFLEKYKRRKASGCCIIL